MLEKKRDTGHSPCTPKAIKTSHPGHCSITHVLRVKIARHRENPEKENATQHAGKRERGEGRGCSEGKLHGSDSAALGHVIC